MTATIPVSGLTCPPLFGTPRSDRPTLGPRVGEIAALMGKPLMPHQQYQADVALEIDPDTGLLAYDEIIVIGPRQVTGKTEWLLPMMVHRCTGFDADLAAWVRRELGRDVPVPGPQTVLYTAQTADEARKKWRDTHLARLLKVPRLKRQFKPRLRLNAEAMMWRNGSVWSPVSTTGKTAGTGDTADLGVIDEAWSRPDNRTELGMRPAQLTRDWSQMLITSMIPGLSRALPGTWKYLQGKRQVGRARVQAGVRHGTALFDYSAPEGLDPGDPATWWLCMPGLGRTVRETKVRADFEKMCGVENGLIDFCAEYLGWEPKANTPRWTVFDETLWATELCDPASTIAGTPALSVEANEERSRAWILAAGKRADGHWHVEVVEPGFKVPLSAVGMDWVLPRVLEIMEARNAATVAIDPQRPASSLIVPLRNAGVDVYTPPVNAVAGACGRFYDATGSNRDPEHLDDGTRVFHLGQKELTDSLGVATTLDQGNGSFVFVKRGSSGELCPLNGVVLAMLGHEVKAPVDYDVLESVDGSRPCLRCGRSVYAENGLWLHASDDTPEC